MQDTELRALAREIGDLPQDFHEAGVLGKEVLLALCDHLQGMEVLNSVETGSGKSTLLLSRISAHHTVFTLGEWDGQPLKSLTAVRESPLFNAGSVEFVLGPTQRTLPRHAFSEPLQLVLLDGPHGFPFPQLEYYFLYPHLAENGLFVIDDIHIPTIAQLDRFVREDAMFEHVGTVGTTSFHRRTAAPTFDPCGDGWWEQNYNSRRFERLKAGYYRPTVKTRIYNLMAEKLGEDFANGMRRNWRRATFRGNG